MNGLGSPVQVTTTRARSDGRAEEIAAGLREEGLDARLRGDGAIYVGPRDRGADAPEAVVVIGEAALDEHLHDLSAHDGRVELAPDRLVMLVLEDLTVLHDGGESNLTTQVSRPTPSGRPGSTSPRRRRGRCRAGSAGATVTSSCSKLDNDRVLALLRKPGTSVSTARSAGPMPSSPRPALTQPTRATATSDPPWSASTVPARGPTALRRRA